MSYLVFGFVIFGDVIADRPEVDDNDVIQFAGDEFYPFRPFVDLDPTSIADLPVTRKRFVSYFRCFGWGPNCGVDEAAASGAGTPKGPAAPTRGGERQGTNERSSKVLRQEGGGVGGVAPPEWTRSSAKFEPFFPLTSGKEKL